MQAIADHLSGTMRVLVPVHRGWNGTPRPGRLSAVSDLAADLRLLEDEGHRDVLVIGSSMGGWIGADMAARDDGHLITGAGHLPQIEQPAATFGALDAYLNKNVTR